MLDEIRSSSDKDFYAIQTQNHNTFYLVVDHASSSDNVYMLSTIDENDLEEFLKEKKEAEPEPVIVEEPVAEPEEPEEPEPKKKSGGLGWLILLMLAAAGAIGGYYYFRFYKPSQEEDDVESENMEYSDTQFPTENEDDVEETLSQLDDLGFDAFYELDGEYYGWKRTLPPPYDDFDEGDLIAAEVLAEKLVSNYE